MTTRERLLVTEQSTCFACGPHHPHGLRLAFTVQEDGSVEALWTPTPAWEGFTGIIHGGILATLVDEAMSKAVVTAGRPGVTGDLRVRFRHPVATGDPLCIRGWITRQRGRLLYTEATITTTAGAPRVHARATFALPAEG